MLIHKPTPNLIHTKTIWASLKENLTVACEQQRCRSAWVSMQSDQRLCYLQTGKSNSPTSSMQNFNIPASLCSWAGGFGAYLIRNLKNRFSHIKAHMYILTLSPWEIFHAFLSSADFFKINLFRKKNSVIPSECQTVWIQIRPDICQAWSGSNLFAKVISRQHDGLLYIQLNFGRWNSSVANTMNHWYTFISPGNFPIYLM